MNTNKKSLIAFLLTLICGAMSWGANLEQMNVSHSSMLPLSCSAVVDGDENRARDFVAALIMVASTDEEADINAQPDQHPATLTCDEALTWPELTDERADVNSAQETLLYILPLELVTALIQYVSVEDIARFRLCSRWCRDMVGPVWLKLLDESNRIWKMRYWHDFSSPPILSRSFGDVLRGFASHIGMTCEKSVEKEEIVWRNAYIDKSRALAWENSMKVYFLGWTSDQKDAKYFCGANLRNWSPSTLSRFDFSYGKFTCANLSASDVSNVDFTGALCKYANFERACLARHISSMGGRSVPMFLRKVTMKGTDISGANFIDAYFFSTATRVSLADLKEMGCIWDDQEPPTVGSRN